MIKLRQAILADAEKIYNMQVACFAPLLEKYQDFDTNPGAEKIDRTILRLQQSNGAFYFVSLNGVDIGAIRVVQNGNTCRLMQLFILPEYQGGGRAQLAIVAVEKLYPDCTTWELDTILQEDKLCHLYEKMGYVKTGSIEYVKDGMDIVFYRKQTS